MLWKILFGINAASSLYDACLNFSQFDHRGDMHISYGLDSLVACATFLVIAFHPAVQKWFSTP